MIDHEDIRAFVTKTLGCNCPHEVLQNIDCRSAVRLDDGTLLEYEINIGNRLLIFVVTVDEPDSIGLNLPALVEAGVGTRDNKGFNRFRLVLLSQDVGPVAEEASRIFESLAADDKTHLHIVRQDESPFKC